MNYRVLPTVPARYRALALLSLIAALLITTTHSAVAADAQIGASTSSLTGLERGDLPRVLATEEAFPFRASVKTSGEIALTWTPAPDHYLYRHRFNFTLLPPEGDATAQVLGFTVPEGKAMEDEFFGAIEAYFEPITVLVTLPPSYGAGSLLSIEYQGCAAWGFCYPPQRTELPVSSLLP